MMLRKELRDFPGSPVVKTPRCHCQGHRFLSLVRELRSHMLHGMAKNRKRKKERKKRKEGKEHSSVYGKLCFMCKNKN